MPKPVSLPPVIQKATAIFATLLIVGGIVMIAYVSSEKKTEMSATPAAPEALPNTGLTGPKLLLQSDHAMTVMTLEGQTERFETMDALLAKYGSSVIRPHGTEAATGAQAIFATTTDAIAKGQIAPHRSQFAVLGEAQSDGAGTIVVTREDGQIVRVVARTADGKPVRLTTLAGWFDDETLVVVATEDENRFLAAIPLVGSSVKVRDLGTDILFVTAQSGFAWLMTGKSGEGLESPPMGPSELIRVSRNGESLSIAEDELRVISSVVTDESNHLAYTTDDGQSFVMTATDPSTKTTLGSRRPLQFMRDGKLLVREGFNLGIFDLTTDTAATIGSLPEGSIRVFLFEDAS